MSFDLSRLLRPKSIAILGGWQAEEVVKQCQRMGFAGDIWPVHPKKDQVLGHKVYRSIADLPDAPDATFIGVNRQLTVEVVRQLAGRHAGGAVCYASGFLEADDTGAGLQAELLEAAGAMPVLGPNCYGLINYAEGALLWPDQHGGRRLAANERGVAIITQSSNLSINLTMQQRGLPIAYMLTAGNQAQIGLSELALAVLDDPRVSALGMHIEGFDSVQGMEALAQRARELAKPVVALKVGRSTQAQQAAMTHTASLAGSHAASSAFLKRLGIGEVDSIEGMLETLKLLHVHGPLAGYSLCSMSCSGGEASLMADAAQGRKVFFPALSAEQKAPVEAVLGERVTVDNPLDYHTYIWSDEAGMSLAYQRMMENGFDLSLLVLDFPHPERCDDALWEVALRAFELAVKNSGAKAAVLASLPENLPEKYVRRLMANGVAGLGGMASALRAAEVAADIGNAWVKSRVELVVGEYIPTLAGWAESEILPVPPFAKEGTLQQKPVLTGRPPPLFRTFCKNVAQGERGGFQASKVRANLQTLNESTAKQWLSQHNIPVPKGITVDTPNSVSAAIEQLGNTFPLVAKKLNIAHKTEANAVHLNLQNAQEVQAAVDDLLADGGEVLIEAMVQSCVGELIVGLVRDPQFGLVMTLGAGGIFVEVLKDTATLLLPATRGEIQEALAGLRIAPLFKGYRGKPEGDMGAVVDTVLAIQDFALAQGDSLVELDINPLMVGEQGQGVCAADVLIVIESEVEN